MYYAYEETIKLHHNEVPAKINVETGIVSEIEKKTIPKGKENVVKFDPEALFSKHYNKAWEFLYYKLSPLEIKVALYLAMKAKAFTNSLEPLNDDTSVREISDLVGISVGKVKPVFERLFQLGVYGKFEIVEAKKGYTKYWVLNPFLSFNGATIQKGIVELFRGTQVALSLRK